MILTLRCGPLHLLLYLLSLTSHSWQPPLHFQTPCGSEEPTTAHQMLPSKPKTCGGTTKTKATEVEGVVWCVGCSNGCWINTHMGIQFECDEMICFRFIPNSLLEKKIQKKVRKRAFIIPPCDRKVPRPIYYVVILCLFQMDKMEKTTRRFCLGLLVSWLWGVA